MSEWYLDFLDLNYRPSKDDLVCLFRIEPAKGFSIKEVAGRVASESSVGTWTKLTFLPKRIKDLMAKAFEIKGNYVKVAYPIELFEPGNMPQILSSIAGNIFGMKAVRNIRLEDVHWPYRLIKSFKGPQFGIKGIRKLLQIEKRPITITVVKPKLGLTSKEHARIGYESWLGGIDLLKDDENLSSQSFNKFEERVKESLRMRDKAERETGERKSYLINITSETKEMLKRAKFVADNGGEYVMVDIITTGWAGLQTVRNECEDLDLAIHAHRASHASMTRSRYHGISMLVIADVARLIGVDQLHIGTVVGKLESPKDEVIALNLEIEKQLVKGHGHILSENWYNVKPVLAVVSGGLHAGLIPYLIKMLGKDIAIQVGGGIHALGARIGAKAVRQAIDATLQNTSLREYAKTHSELKKSLNKFGFIHPK